MTADAPQADHEARAREQLADAIAALDSDEAGFGAVDWHIQAAREELSAVVEGQS